MHGGRSKFCGRTTTNKPTQFVELPAARRFCTDSSGDGGMRKASTELLEQWIQAPSPAPDLIPAEPIIDRGLRTGSANGDTSDQPCRMAAMGISRLLWC